MQPDERAAKRLADQQRRRREQRERKQAAAAVAMSGAAEAPCSFDTALEQVATDAALGDVEQQDFSDWLLDAELWPDSESLGEWRGSAAYERTKHERAKD